MIKLSLTASHLNRLLEKAGVSYAEGTFLISRKLPLGSATLVAIPTLEGRELELVLPFERIRGDLAGALVGQVAKMLWGVVTDQVYKEAGPRLVALGLPSDTLNVDHTTFLGKKAGRITISLHRVNEWMARQKWVDPLHLSVEGLTFEEHFMGVQLGLT